MTVREFWLKLFSENDTALISAVILIERFVTEKQLQSGQEYIQSRKKELYEKAPETLVKDVFPLYQEENDESLLESLKCCITSGCDSCPSKDDGLCNRDELVNIPLWLANKVVALLEYTTSVNYKIRNAYDFVTTVKEEESKLKQLD